MSLIPFKKFKCKNHPNCLYGEMCNFYHDESERRFYIPCGDNYKKAQCKFYKNELYCKHGENCKFWHTQEDRRFNVPIQLKWHLLKMEFIGIGMSINEAKNNIKNSLLLLLNYDDKWLNDHNCNIFKRMDTINNLNCDNQKDRRVEFVNLLNNSIDKIQPIIYRSSAFITIFQ